MPVDAGPILFALILGVLLAAAMAWIVAALYRRRIAEADLAKADISGADITGGTERCVWVEAGHLAGAKAGEVLDALFGDSRDTR